MVYTYYGKGQLFVEDELQGNCRASYGKCVLDSVSEWLMSRYGASWWVKPLESATRFNRLIRIDDPFLPDSVHAVDRNQGNYREIIVLLFLPQSLTFVKTNRNGYDGGNAYC